MRHNPDSKVRFIATSICDCKLLNRVAEKKRYFWSLSCLPCYNKKPSKPLYVQEAFIIENIDRIPLELDMETAKLCKTFFWLAQIFRDSIR